MTKRNINESRMLARLQQYGNREQERAAIEAVDDLIFAPSPRSRFALCRYAASWSRC